MIRHEDIDDGALTSKCHKVWCCACLIPCNCFFHPCRKAVSGKKKRMIKEGFDLDMAYITPRIIVHGFPAHGLEHMYRNPRYEIKRYMDKYHKDNYKMFNFCCEPGRGYHPDVFHGRVERYPFKDHNTPPLETMLAFTQSAKQWLEEDENHVVNMHCKAGKGRAGLMCCVLLVRTGAAPSAIEAMNLYDRERVTNNRGLTVTSQRKFVIFYEQLWRECWGVSGNIGDVTAEEASKFVLPKQPKLRLTGVEVLNLPSGIVKSFSIQVSKITNFLPQLLFDSKTHSGQNVQTDCDVDIEGNFKVFIKFKKGLMDSPVRLVELQHNTYFMSHNSDYVDFGVDQLDIKKKMKAKLGPNIVLRLKFNQQPQGEEIGDGKGYEMVATTDEGENVALEMVNVNTEDATESSVSPAPAAGEADASTPLMAEETPATSEPASAESTEPSPVTDAPAASTEGVSESETPANNDTAASE